MEQLLEWLNTFPQIEKKDWKKMELFLNKEQNDFLVKLRADYPILLEEDIHIIILLRLGVSHENIACIFHILLASFRTRRYRIKKKMGIKDEYHFTEFILKLYE